MVAEPQAIYYRWILTKSGRFVNWVPKRNDDDQASQPRNRAYDREGAPGPARQVRAPEQDASHRQAPERARDAQPRRPAADAAGAVGCHQQGHRGVSRGDRPGAGQARLRDGGDGRPVRDPGQPDVQPDRGRVRALNPQQVNRGRVRSSPASLFYAAGITLKVRPGEPGCWSPVSTKMLEPSTLKARPRSKT